jgi:hypothetical protein
MLLRGEGPLRGVGSWGGIFINKLMLFLAITGILPPFLFCIPFYLSAMHGAA